MTVVNYYTVGGQLLGEQTTGQPPRDYVTDALGSVVGTVTSTGQAENTYRYKPYGALLAKTGTAPDPAFTWVGSQGYRQTGKKYSDVYVRARHYDSTGGRWTTKDPIGRADGLNLFEFVRSTPVLMTDPSGTLMINPSNGYPPIVGHIPNCTTDPQKYWVWTLDLNDRVPGPPSLCLQHPPPDVASTCSGYIVQKVTITHTSTPCRCPQNPPPPATPYVFFELWPVPVCAQQGVDYFPWPDCKVDRFATSGDLFRADTSWLTNYGSFQIAGEGRFYCHDEFGRSDFDIGNNPAVINKCAPATKPGVTPISWQIPPTGRPAFHTLSGTFTCCGGSNFQDVVGTP